jgi:thiamine biosynthesis lipoprotein ApbE
MQNVSLHPLETRIFVVANPPEGTGDLLEYGHERLRRLRSCRPPGLAVDEVVEDLIDRGASGVLVQLDGIVRVAGSSPTADGWLTVVAHPRGHFATAVLRIGEGAVATVSRGGPDHLVAVSVVAGQAWEAELLASTALAAGDEHGGPEGAEQVLRTAGVAGLLIDEFEQSRPVGGWDGLSAAGQPRLLARSA